VRTLNITASGGYKSLRSWTVRASQPPIYPFRWMFRGAQTLARQSPFVTQSDSREPQMEELVRKPARAVPRSRAKWMGVALACAMLGSGAALAQTSLGSSTSIVFPVVAATATFTGHVTLGPFSFWGRARALASPREHDRDDKNRERKPERQRIAD
jgi:hypothetical protein